MADEVASSYALQLQDLKMNSKPVINVLTMMAEDYIRSAPIVVQTIEKHLARVSQEFESFNRIRMFILKILISIVSLYPILLCGWAVD